MKLKLTRHFQDMMQHRGIELEHVKQAIKAPDELIDAHEGALKAIKQVGEKQIEVIYSKGSFRDKKDEFLVITAYYL